MRKFFETVATRIKHVYEVANRDADNWIRAVMAPMETQVREHHLQLRRRLESVKRIHNASEELEGRMRELDEMRASTDAQIAELSRLVGRIEVGVRIQQTLALTRDAA
jgi:hypothetical protein